MTELHWAILIAANLPLYWFFGWLIFRTWEEFFSCIRFWLKPDILSALHGEYWDDAWAEMKLFVWAGICGLNLLWESAILTQFLEQ